MQIHNALARGTVQQQRKFGTQNPDPFFLASTHPRNTVFTHVQFRAMSLGNAVLSIENTHTCQLQFQTKSVTTSKNVTWDKDSLGGGRKTGGEELGNVAHRDYTSTQGNTNDRGPATANKELSTPFSQRRKSPCAPHTSSRFSQASFRNDPSRTTYAHRNRKV